MGRSSLWMGERSFETRSDEGCFWLLRVFLIDCLDWRAVHSALMLMVEL